jgi:hypothetical protein
LLGTSGLLGRFSAWPLAQPEEVAPPARLVGPLLLAAGVAVLIAVRLSNPYDARHPQVSYVGYQVDQDTGRAWRFSASPDLPKWSETVLKDGGGRVTKLKHWTFRKPVDAAAAPFVQEASPVLTLTKDADGRLRLHAARRRARASCGCGCRRTPPRRSKRSAASRQTGAEGRRRMRLGWERRAAGRRHRDPGGAQGALDVGYAATLERWPAGVTPLPKRPADLMAFDVSDSTFVVGTRRFSW